MAVCSAQDPLYRPNYYLGLAGEAEQRAQGQPGIPAARPCGARHPPEGQLRCVQRQLVCPWRPPLTMAMLRAQARAS
jgi:hypothetical protein